MPPTAFSRRLSAGLLTAALLSALTQPLPAAPAYHFRRVRVQQRHSRRHHVTQQHHTFPVHYSVPSQHHTPHPTPPG